MQRNLSELENGGAANPNITFLSRRLAAYTVLGKAVSAEQRERLAHAALAPAVLPRRAASCAAPGSPRRMRSFGEPECYR